MEVSVFLSLVVKLEVLVPGVRQGGARVPWRGNEQEDDTAMANMRL